jgi:SAP domain-containing new25
MTQKLHPKMMLAQFDNGYWYVGDLKAFAKTLGVPTVSKLRKDELEAAIRGYLVKGKVEARPKAAPKIGARDIVIGLRLDLPIRHYTSNKTTKTFIAAEAEKIAPGLKKKSGARYRLNRWREDQISKGKTITYGDLVRQYVILNQAVTPFARVPHGRYINFIADFSANEPSASRTEALEAWQEVKRMDTLKTYAAWKKSARRR